MGAFQMWKCEHLDDVALSLIEQNIIDLAGEVDDDMWDHVREALLRLRAKGSPDITIQISSIGGNVDAGLSIYDALRLYPGKTTGVVLGQAASMGAIVLQACNVRKCSIHSAILIHHVATEKVSIDILRDPKKLKLLLESGERKQAHLYTILCARAGKGVKRIRKACGRDKYMTAEEALNFGLIDEIV